MHTQPLTPRQRDGLDCSICGRPLDRPDSPASTTLRHGTGWVLNACLVPLDQLADRLHITQTVNPWQPLSGVDLLRAFDGTLNPDSDTVDCQHARLIREAWEIGRKQTAEADA